MKNLLLSCLLFVSVSAFAQTEIRFYTTMGEFDLEVREDLVPITAGNFIGLVEDKFYDGIIFHRIVSNFVIQGGDPTGTGAGGSGIVIPDEFTGSLSNLVRTISMANSGPNTGTSQFFINLVNNLFLDYDQEPLTSAHPVFGEIVAGWSIVEDIESVPVGAGDRPITDVVMDSLRIINAATGIEYLAVNFGTFEIIGNPVNSQSQLSLTLTEAEELTISIFGLQGRALNNAISVNANAGQNTISLTELSLDNLTSGSYFLMLSGQKGDLRVIPFIK
jgi:cyclophilin family peptidyl-prolyl cis-trans isomerase